MISAPIFFFLRKAFKESYFNFQLHQKTLFARRNTHRKLSKYVLKKLLSLKSRPN